LHAGRSRPSTATVATRHVVTHDRPQAIVDKRTLSSSLVAFVREQEKKKINILNLNVL